MSNNVLNKPNASPWQPPGGAGPVHGPPNHSQAAPGAPGSDGDPKPPTRSRGKSLHEEKGRSSLRDHIVEKAMAARLKYGLYIDADAITKMLDDPQVVRYPTGLRFDAEPLLPGEFAQALPLGEQPCDGFCVFVHPWFEKQQEIWPLLVAYHLVRINYGEITGPEEAELFGATLLGLDPDIYYKALCELADSLPA